jgi:outer membrane biosynthesis protein TonB
MPESTRPPPPKTGSGGFVAAAVIMLLLMGGLIYWKVSGQAEPPPPVVTTPPVDTETVPTLEAPPPPPPKLEEVEDAGKRVVKTARTTGGGGGCAGECTGTVPAALQGALRAKAGAARGCYERALRQNAMLQGKIMVAVRVGAQGQICSASIVSNTLGDPGVASCVLGMIRSSSLPPPNGGCVDVQVPMNFVPSTGS